jgi:hypothetical protein
LIDEYEEETDKCDYCGEPAEGTYNYEDDPDFDYYVCADCPQFADKELGLE